MLKILLVDDNQTNIMLFRCFLERENYAVITANNGMESISMALEHQPDVILMDLMMPVMNGVEATFRLKNCPETRHIPIVIMTADDSLDSHAQAQEAGCDEYMLKPIRFDMLRKVLELIVQSARFIKTMALPQTESFASP